jgi:hypothetical protein
VQAIEECPALGAHVFTELAGVVAGDADRGKNRARVVRCERHAPNQIGRESRGGRGARGFRRAPRSGPAREYFPRSESRGRCAAAPSAVRDRGVALERGGGFVGREHERRRFEMPVWRVRMRTFRRTIGLSGFAHQKLQPAAQRGFARDANGAGCKTRRRTWTCARSSRCAPGGASAGEERLAPAPGVG